MSHSHLTSVIPPALSMANLGECELRERLALPEMIIDGSSQMPDTWCAGLVGLELEATLFTDRC